MTVRRSKMFDFVAELVGGMIELAVDLLFEPWISKLIERQKQEKGA